MKLSPEDKKDGNNTLSKQLTMVGWWSKTHSKQIQKSRACHCGIDKFYKCFPWAGLDLEIVSATAISYNYITNVKLMWFIKEFVLENRIFYYFSIELTQSPIIVDSISLLLQFAMWSI